MEEKELKINIPKGYKIDREKSTFEHIIFKKIDPLAKLPKTWKEYRMYKIGDTSYYYNDHFKSITASKFLGLYNEFSTIKRAEQYAALGKLLQLRDYWTNNWESDKRSFIIYVAKFETLTFRVATAIGTNYTLTFPTEQMAEEFIKCFKDLLIKASPLL